MNIRVCDDRYLDELEDEVKKLKGHIRLLRLTLTHAQAKLEIYRDYSSGQYHGGVEHVSLMRMIRQGFKTTEPEE